MNGRRPSSRPSFALYLLFFFLSSALGALAAQSEPPVGRSATPYVGDQASEQQAQPWDVVVLGRIDACWVCQHGPPPHVSYGKVLAGKAPGGKARGEVDLIDLPVRLLPQGGVPYYRSQREEICYLKMVSLAGNEGGSYTVVDVEEATPENLGKFQSGGRY